jgi:hypothetical protein
MFDEVVKSKTGLTVGRFLEKMNDSAFDPQSFPGHHMKWISNTKEVLPIPTEAKSEATKGIGESRRGSGGGAGRGR